MRQLLVTVSFALVCLAGSAFAESGATLHCPRTAGSLVVVFSETPGGVLGNGSVLRIYGDGRFTVVRPPHEKGAGEWVARLSSAEMEQLCEALAARRIHLFDAGVVRAAKRAAGGRRTWVATDPEATRLVLHTRVPLADGAFAEQEETLSWVGLAADARQHPEIAALQDFAAIASALRAFFRDPRLQRSP